MAQLVRLRWQRHGFDRGVFDWGGDDGGAVKAIEFVSNPFYIAGESYAGIYVSTLASQVVKGIKDGAKPKINFKGYMVGNGVTDPVFDGNSFVTFAHGMALISDDIFEVVVASCGADFTNSSTAACAEKLSYVYVRTYRALAGLNIYDILEPCYHYPTSLQGSKGNTSLPDSFRKLGATPRPLAVRTRMFGRACLFRASVKDGIVPWPQLAQNIKNSVPNNEVATRWLNDAAVRKATHAETVNICLTLSPSVEIRVYDPYFAIPTHFTVDNSLQENIAGPWVLCTDRISIIMIGDHDMCEPYTGTQAWTKSLGYKTVSPWRSWTSNDQVSG
ncbi:Serine carboxypeptidase 1 [Hibiscus syriacus]|uniref:Carboxypeptidase n=1 Tax=Hibiscus syriacus TaxID=106335 RepID=A0A6A2X6S5_HIBSY|nr:Serine carboxypeptidase 1 [Hibiscus syriacus]